MTNVSNLTEIEIQTKLGAAIMREVAKGKALSDFSSADDAAIVASVMSSFSPAAIELLKQETINRAVRAIYGQKIAERIWSTGKGWLMPKPQVMEIITSLDFDDPEDGFKSFEVFREDAPHLTEEQVSDLGGFVARFIPLFLAQPAGSTLGEIATMKAARGDKLAMSFLAWKEIE